MNVPQSKVLFLVWFMVNKLLDTLKRFRVLCYCSFAQVKSVLAVASGKGGVGKSSVPELNEDFKEGRQ